MFTLQYIQAIYSIFLPLNPLNYDTYVYLEDSDEIVTYRLRNWNRWDETSVSNQDVVKVIIFQFLDRKELNFLSELWTTFTSVTGIE